MKTMIRRAGVIGLGGVIALATQGVFAEEEFPPLFPFVISYDAPDNASNVAHLLDSPAGKHGFIRVEDGRFVDDRGPVRLHGTNLTGPANFPTHEAADKLAARLARFGINCVRLHYFDAAYGNALIEPLPGIFGDAPTSQRVLDPEQVDRQDYLIAALKRRGIYVDMNLHVARTLDEHDGFREGKPWADRGLDQFEPRIIALEKEYAKKLLTRVNPYTGLAYTDDPCVAVIEINNENALFQVYFSGLLDNMAECYVAEFQRQWNAWLGKRYASTEALKQAWHWVATPLCDEQIAEGDFSRPVAFDNKTWFLEAGPSGATCATDKGVLTLKTPLAGDGAHPKLARSVSVKKGQPYTVAFRIRRVQGSGEARLNVAVADSTGGWRLLGLLQPITVGSDWKKAKMSFVAGDDSDRARLQWTRFEAGEYEIDDLSFQSGAESNFNTMARLEDGTIPVVKASGYVPEQARRDFYEFLVDTERAYWTGMRDYLKNDLKAKAMISGTQMGYSPPHVQAELDYIDMHSYWCHPRVGQDWHIRNVPMVNSMACIQGLAEHRVHGKPYTVSEYNHPFPNQYGAEGQPMLRAYGALHGWDGVFEYTYNHSPDFEPKRNTYFFSMIARTDVLAHLPACATMYLRGDVREAERAVVGAIGFPDYFDRLVATRSISAGLGQAGIEGLDRRLTLIHKTAVDLTGKQATDAATPAKPEGKVLVSDTGELTWNTEQADAAYWTVNSQNTKVFTGFPKGRTVALGDVTLAVGRTRLDWATVSLVSRRATGFGETERPASILLTATGLSENEGTVIERLSDTDLTFRDRKAWGDGTVLVEGIPATITLPSSPDRTKCFALGPDGSRKGEVPVHPVDGGGSKIVLGPEYQTVWYEIEVE